MVRNLALATLVTAIGGLFCGCGGEEASTPDAPPGEIGAQLAALPGVTVTEWIPPSNFTPEPGYRYFDLWFTQPIDHDHPEAGTFQQYVALMHRDSAAPLVIYTSGYDAGWKRFRTEPSTLLDANQISIEYRFYNLSKPENRAAIDWSKLNVHQNAEDEHAIITELESIYTGKRIQTGGSKGGENSMFHEMLHPEDLDGVVAYVAPVITDDPDLRYATVLDDIGIASCRTALRALQREMLMRRAAMETRAAAVAQYRVAGVSHATETAIVELEFSFWMTRGEPDCPMVPPTTASDDDLFMFLEETGGPEAYGDAELHKLGQQYIFQDQLELGYPVWEHQHLDDLMQFSYEDWSAYMPAPDPVYNPAAPRALATWLATMPGKLMHIGGEWDPWGPGYPQIKTGADTLDFRVPHGSHWSSGIYSLKPADQALAIATLRRWAGLPEMRERIIVPTPPAPIPSKGPTDRLVRARQRR
jgi:hypothetical protein